MGKQYDITFQMDARLGSGYSGAFRNAQAAISQYRKEYAQASTELRDISGFQKQQQAAENTRGRLEILKQQYANIQREMDETGNHSSALANKLLDKKAQIDKVTQAYQVQIERLNAYRQKLQDAGVDTSKLDEETERLKKELDDLKKKMDEAGDGAESFGERGGQAVSKIAAALAAAGITKMLKEIYDAFLECVGIAGDFEEAMSNVEALSGASASEIAELSEMAQHLGATTKFTAKESADAMGYMAMAGWDVTDMLYGMDGVLQLAAASGEDLATVSDIVTDSLSAFGLKSSDAAHFSDVLAAAATNSNTNVSIMGETFKMSASIAGALGYSIEDVAVAVGLMANSGVKGSVAGTALKNTFNGLLEGVTLTGAAFGEYEFAAVKADGTMKDFGSTIDELRVYFAQMTEAERVNNAMAIAGQRGYNGLLAILNAADEDYASLTNSINNCTGAASKMASIKLDNMNGQLTLAKSAWDALEMSIGESLTPTLKEIYSVAASVFSDISEFIKKYPEIIKIIAALTAGLGTFVVALTAYIAITKLAKLATEALTASMAANKFIMLASAVALVVTTLVAHATAASNAEEETEQLTAASERQREELEFLQSEYNDVCEAQGATSTEATLLKRKIDEETAAFEQNKKTQQEYLEERQAVLEAHKDLIDSYSESAESIELEWESTQNLISRLNELTTAELQSASAKQEILAIVDILNERIPELGLNYDILTGKLNMTPDAVLSAARRDVAADKNAANNEALRKAIKEEEVLRAQYEKDLDEAEALEKEYGRLKEKESYYDSFKPVLNEGDGTYTYVSPDGKESYTDVGLSEKKSSLYTEIRNAKSAWDVAKTTAEGSKAAWDENIALQNELADTIASTTEEVAAGNEAINDMAEITGRMEQQLGDLADAYSEAYNAAFNSISGQYELWDTVPTVVSTGVDAVIDAQSSQASYWTNYNANLESLYERTGRIEGLGPMIASFADGSAESVNMIAGLAASTDEELTALVGSWQENQAAQQEASETIAKITTDYDASVQEIIESNKTFASEMDMTDEAAERGRNTIQGFIDGAEDMLPAVQAAYASVGQAAMDAIDQQLDIHSPSRVMMEKARMTWAGYINETVSMQPDISAAMKETAELGADAFSEDETKIIGVIPQLMESMSARSVDAIAAESLAPGGGIVLHFAPSYSITGASSPDEIREILAAHDAEMKEQLRELLAEEQEDAQRRAYV